MDPATRLVTIPVSDREFAADARALAERTPPDLEPDQALRWFERELRMRYPTAVVRPQEDLAKPYPEAEPVWYATRREYRSRISAAVVVPVAQSVAFGIYTDRVTEWQSSVDLRPIRITGDLVGDEYDACYRLFGREFHGRFQIVAADPPHMLSTEAGGSGIRVWYVTRFTPATAGTRVTVEGDYDLPEGLIPRIADRLFIERAIERDIEGAHRTFEALCDAVGGEVRPDPHAHRVR